MPTRGAVAIETTIALISNVGVPHCHVTVVRKPVVKARNELARIIRKVVADDGAPFTPSEYFVLWLDDDAWFPPGIVPAIVQWLSANREADLVAGFFSPRSERHTPIAFAGDQVVDQMTNCTIGDVVEITRCGFHFALHRASLLDRIGDDPFSLPTVATNSERHIVAEDFAFCDRAVAAGARLFCATGALIFHVDVESGHAYIPGETAFRISNNAPVRVEDRSITMRAYGDDVDAVFECSRALSVSG